LKTLLDLKEFDDITRSGIAQLVKLVFVISDRKFRLPKRYKHWHSSLANVAYLLQQTLWMKRLSRLNEQCCENSGLVLCHDNFASNCYKKGFSTDQDELDKKHFGFAEKYW